MKFDDVLRQIGEFGPYQKRVYFLVTIPVAFIAIEVVSAVFIFNIPPHRCAIPGYPDDQFQVVNDTHAYLINASIPRDEEKEKEYSQCLLYSDVSYDGVLANNSDAYSGEAEERSTGSNKTFKCDKWVFDHSVFESTIATDFDIVCDRSVYRASSNMIGEMGCVLGAVGSGLLADRFGRKVPVMIGIVALVGGGFGIAFARDLIMLNVCRFSIGVARVVLWVNGLVLGMEIVGPTKRVFAGTVIEVVWCFGMFYLLLHAFLLRNWRHLEIAVSIPSVGLLAYWWLIPESPRWLASKGRNKEAMRVLEKITTSNHTKLPEVDDVKELLEAEEYLSVRHIFRSRELVKRLLIVFSNMFVVVMMYNALMYNIANLAGDVFINFLLNTIMETVGVSLPYLVLDRLGRRKVYCLSVLLGGIVCVVCVIPALFNAPDLVIISLAIIGRFLVCVAFAVLYIYGAELFPTVIRGTTMGVGVTFARFAGILSPYVADVGILVGGKLEKALPLILMGSPALVVGVIALWLPETKGTRLPETLDDIQISDSKQRSLCTCTDQHGQSDVQEVTADEEVKAMTTSTC